MGGYGVVIMSAIEGDWTEAIWGLIIFHTSVEVSYKIQQTQVGVFRFQNRQLQLRVNKDKICFFSNFPFCYEFQKSSIKFEETNFNIRRVEADKVNELKRAQKLFTAKAWVNGIDEI